MCVVHHAQKRVPPKSSFVSSPVAGAFNMAAQGPSLKAPAPGLGSAALSRISDASKDGALRTSLAGLFYLGLPALALEETLAPIRNLCAADLSFNIEISRNHAANDAVAEAYKDLSEDERAALTLYTMESYPKEKSVYFLVNAALRAQDRGGVRPYRDYIWLLMHALRRLPPSPATIAHRGMKCALSALGDYDPKTEVSWGAFSSVTTDLAVMKEFLGKAGPRVLVNIELQPGVARDIISFSMFPAEKELLLPPNTLFRVESVLEDAGGGLAIVQLRMIEPKDEILSLWPAWECEADAGRWVTVKGTQTSMTKFLLLTRVPPACAPPPLQVGPLLGRPERAPHGGAGGGAALLLALGAWTGVPHRLRAHDPDQHRD